MVGGGVEFFFGRPGQPWPLERLLADLRGASKSLIIAAAYVTDLDIADAIIWSRAPDKLLILNRSDLNRDSGKEALERLHDYFARSPAPAGGKRLDGIRVLGGHTWQDGIMHHKYVVIDRRVVWTGSANLTWGSHKRNYDLMIRAASAVWVRAFLTESRELARPRPVALDPFAEDVGRGGGA